MEETSIKMSLVELQAMLDEQKRVTGEYMTKNLSVYGEWWQNVDDLNKVKEDMKAEAKKSGYPTEFMTLKKYIKF